MDFPLQYSEWKYYKFTKESRNPYFSGFSLAIPNALMDSVGIRTVAILILVDFPLQLNGFGDKTAKKIVAILILVDFPLQ